MTGLKAPEEKQMKQLIIFATGNKGKIREIRDIITDPDTEVLSMKEAGVAADPDESGATFEENALIKARAVAKLVRQKIEDGTFFFDGADGTRSFDTDDIQITVMSDDSGLVIDALNGEPGIYSARYLGHDTDYNYKMTQIMKRMENVPDEERTARFVAAVAAVFPDGSEHVVRGAMEGVIAHGIYGKNGFGYDPFFYLPEYGKTSAEITEEEKNAISHRGKALRAMNGAAQKTAVQRVEKLTVNFHESIDPRRYTRAGRYFPTDPCRGKRIRRCFAHRGLRGKRVRLSRTLGRAPLCYCGK